MKNEKLQSRREFFKNAAKATLPILGVIALTNISYASGSKSEIQLGCTSTCKLACAGNCYTGCEGKCSDHCAHSCSESCRDMCKGQIK